MIKRPYLVIPLILVVAVINIAAAVFSLMYGLGLIDRLTFGDRLTAVAKDYAVHAEVFSGSKIIKGGDGPVINFNGDGSMSGVFQLSKDDVKTLMSSPALLKCPNDRECEIEAPTLSDDKTNYFSSSDISGIELVNFYVHTDSNQVEVSVLWY